MVQLPCCGFVATIYVAAVHWASTCRCPTTLLPCCSACYCHAAATVVAVLPLPGEEEQEWLREMQLLTVKPMIYAANIDEKELAEQGQSNPHVKALREKAAAEGSQVKGFLTCAGVAVVRQK